VRHQRAPLPRHQRAPLPRLPALRSGRPWPRAAKPVAIAELQTHAQPRCVPAARPVPARPAVATRPPASPPPSRGAQRCPAPPRAGCAPGGRPARPPGDAARDARLTTAHLTTAHLTPAHLTAARLTTGRGTVPGSCGERAWTYGDPQSGPCVLFWDPQSRITSPARGPPPPPPPPGWRRLVRRAPGGPAPRAGPARPQARGVAPSPGRHVRG
jgi:hypothetical protein